MDTLQDMIDRLEQYGDRVAMQIGRGEQARRLSYTQLAGRARAIGAGLAATGVSPADKVVLYAGNCPEWGLAYLGIQAAGAVAVGMDPKLKTSDVAHVLSHSEARKAVLATERLAPVYGARPLRRVIQRRIENELAMRLLQGEFGEGATVRVDAAPTGELIFTPVVEGEPVPA